MRELKRLSEKLSRTQGSIQLNEYQPASFDFATTNQLMYKPFTMTQRPGTVKPKVDAVRTSAFPVHYDTYNKREYIPKKHRVPEVDLIPYP